MSSPVSVGDVLGGKFRVERVLGTGGMGVIVAAFHLQLEQEVALKFLLADAAKQPEVVARFAREARAAAKIQSEHVARVIDVGTLETGAPYMVMEYLEGEDLDGLIKREGRVALVDAVSWVLQACEAIAEAHAMGIIHRDLKPANLFLAERSDGSRSIKVLDFGISKVSVEGQMADASLTRTSAVMGSPMYMSPEQLRSARDVDARADIWALGITLYELVCGKGPFSSGTVPEVCAAILKEAPQPPRELREDLPPGLEAVILRCLEKDVTKRYANVAELALALLSFAPPGSEMSIERISRVLQKGARSLRGGGSFAGPEGSPVEPIRGTPASPLELAATNLSRPGPALAEALAETKLEHSTPGAAVAADPSATANATSISALDARPGGAPPERSRAGLVIAAVLLVVAAAAGTTALIRKPAATPEVTTAGEGVEAPVPPEPPVETAAAAAPALPPAVGTPPVAAEASAAPTAQKAPVDPRKQPWGKKPGAAASASASAAPSAAAADEAPSAEPGPTPSSTPSAAPSTAPSAAPKTAPKASSSAAAGASKP
ncbi:MAG: serine/threonine-protein kinase [Polyangiaceae bacterium]